MTPPDFKEFVIRTFDHCNEIMNAKGPDYSGMEDRLANFKEDAVEIGITPQQSLMVLMNKHVKAVKRYAKNGTLSGESIEAKLEDLINYAVLFMALEKDLRKNP